MSNLEELALLDATAQAELVQKKEVKAIELVEAAIERIKDYAAPVNAMRLNKKTPCAKTAVCEECKSPERICNSWIITEKSFPKGRIKVVLINENLGL